jgi:hypothetical protein
MRLASGDRVTIWAARDLERLPVRVEHDRKDASNQYQPVSDTQLLDVRIGADEDLFEKPKGYRPVGAYEELGGAAPKGALLRPEASPLGDSG